MTAMELTTCPDCGQPSEVEWRATLESTDGPVEHARVHCLTGHRFLLPVEWLARTAPPVRPGAPSRVQSEARDAS
ncbi:hypothetical protein GCM10023349_42750 [Nocardioides conyzicola]|uniref:Uncharacterized protein n=1 Tax=Nocardioides conyzicola TaxID=1651781 RepID=A0ABP8XYS0_9ACTN